MVSFREKNASFIVNNLPFVGVIFLSRKEAKGSSFRCLAIPPMNGKSIKTHQPIDLHQSFLVNKKENNSEVENLSICWLLEIASPTETYVYGTTEKQSSEMEQDYIEIYYEKKIRLTCIL